MLAHKKEMLNGCHFHGCVALCLTAKCQGYGFEVCLMLVGQCVLVGVCTNVVPSTSNPL